MKSVGIDLGTTNSVVAFINKQGQPEIVPNKQGGRTTPSVFAIHANGNKIIGKQAVDQEFTNPKNTIRSIKRRMGTKDRLVLNNSSYSPEEISAEIIKKLKSDSEEFLGEEITSAVITVPAYFNNDQRQSTKIAGELAGLKVLRIINEPTAASLAYGLDQKTNEKVLVFDLGGGTFDVTILEITNDGVFEVISTAGDTHLGGDDFDLTILEMLVEKLNEQLNERKFIPYYRSLTTEMDINDILLSAESTARLREAAENIKKQLSDTDANHSEEIPVNIPYLAFIPSQSDSTANTPVHLDTTINSSDFYKQQSVIDNLNKIIRCVDDAMKSANCKESDIDEIVFVGGSTRLKVISKLIESKFHKKPNKSINPDEAVAIGAAIQSGMLTGEIKKDILLIDVTPLSLGIETLGGVMTKIIEKNTTIPVEKTEIFSTAEDNQDQVVIKVYQGEREQARNNKFLGDFTLSEIIPAPRGVPKINVTFDIDVNGILSVHAMDKDTEKEQKVVITGSSSLSSEEIQKMLEDAQANEEFDKIFKELSDLRLDLNQQIIQIESILRETSNDLTDEIISKLNEQKTIIEHGINSDSKDNLIKIKEESQIVIDTASEEIYKKAEEFIQGE